MVDLNSHYRRGRGILFALSVGIFMALGLVAESVAQEIHSASVDTNTENIIVRGSGFTLSTELRMGGVLVANDYVNGNRLEIPFSETLSNAAQWRGSYRLTANDNAWISVYVSAPIPGPAPPPPPPPPPATFLPAPPWFPAAPSIRRISSRDGGPPARGTLDSAA